ncbi:MAG: glycosyltransferase family 2 protein [Candidatus Omnitrophica bacterium]|nr:glycosyltransferase family 2 protein [Candidatus Omnitrophota bacterium]
MKISVIIPTYKRLDQLPKTLQSLQEQKLFEFEILVMDNAGEPATEKMIAELNRTAKIPIRYIVHTEGGNSGARNRGAKEAKGDLLVYTDDDVTFAPGWLMAYDKAFDAHPDMAAAGGCIKPAWETEPPRWLIEYIGDKKVFGVYSLMEPAQEFTLSNKGFFSSCNMAIRRSVFDRTSFRPEIFGTQTIGSGETGLYRALQKEGKLIGYVPDALVHHNIVASRMTVRYICRWAGHHGGCYMYIRWHNQKRNLSALAAEVVFIGRQHWRSWARAPLVRNRRDKKSIDTQYDASFGLCKLAYIWWMLTDPKVKKALGERACA